MGGAGRSILKNWTQTWGVTALWDKSGESVKGKPAVLFFSHGGGGRGREPFEYLAGKFFEQVGETVESRRPTGDEAKEQCRALGKELVKSLK